jgi:hypothetical protein
MSETVLRVEKLENGYTVEVCDPSVMAKNKSPKAPYKSPWKEYAFTTPKEALAFITKVLPTLNPEEDDMGAAFNEACATVED